MCDNPTYTHALSHAGTATTLNGCQHEPPQSREVMHSASGAPAHVGARYQGAHLLEVGVVKHEEREDISLREDMAAVKQRRACLKQVLPVHCARYVDAEVRGYLV